MYVRTYIATYVHAYFPGYNVISDFILVSHIFYCYILNHWWNYVCEHDTYNKQITCICIKLYKYVYRILILYMLKLPYAHACVYIY